jgi:Transposase DDE domain
MSLQRAIQREADEFIAQIREPGSSLSRVSKVAFTKARKKLKHTIFVHISRKVLEVFYKQSPFRRYWKGFRLMACDGSTAEVPNSDEVQKAWGVFKHREDGKAICMARLSQMYDPLNHTTVDACIDSIGTSEQELLWRHLQEAEPGPGDMLIFDRLYASFLLIFYLDKLGTQYCFRMKEQWWKVVEKFYKSGQRSGHISLTLPKKDLEKAKGLGITATSVRCRLVRVELENGTTEILLSSLLDEKTYSIEDHKELYGLRWGAETQYRNMKHKVCIENFSGKSLLSIHQDFHAKVCMLNLTAVLVHPVDEALKEEPKETYTHQVNFTEALSKMKWAPIALFIKQQGMKAIRQLLTWFYNTTEPIRKGRKFNRPKLPKRKFHMNYKPI